MRSNTDIKAISSLLGRISHQPSTAAFQSHTLTGLRPVGMLNVVSTTPARSSVANSGHDARLNRLATNVGEKCGLVAKKLEIPGIHNPDAVALIRHCERLNRLERLRTAEGWPRGRNPWMGGVTEVISQISLNYNGLNAVFQRMRKMQEIATSLSRLAMTTKWDSNNYRHYSRQAMQWIM